jgi:D-serine deaminase-like pyridoxal phosphate-dependent protein
MASTSSAPAAASAPPGDPAALYARYERALADVEPPFAFVDLDALAANAALMLRQAAGLPIRVASKSVRCVDVLRRIYALDPGFRGALAFTPAEALHLAAHGVDDVLVGYPTVDGGAIAEVAALAAASPERAPILMVDHEDHLAMIVAAAREAGTALRVCLDIDVGWWPLGGRMRIGPKRSPLREPEQARRFAQAVVGHPELRLAAVMAYEGHIAGVGDRIPGRPLRSAAIRAMQARSEREIRRRLPRVVASVREVADAAGHDLELVNGGGTGSLARTRAAGVVTELAAGSGFYAPLLFDTYRSLALTPAAWFVLPVVRRPGPRVATALGGGYLASGAAGPDRSPRVDLPAGLRFDSDEGAGEVQTPLVGPAADVLAIGDRVYLRHAKAGELCERFATLHLVAGDRVVDEVPTYRGEGRTFL